MKRVTLSFDNGPTPGVTDNVLDVLSDHGVSSTFFVIGEKVAIEEGQERARRVASEGHWVGNHTSTHTRLFGTSDDPDLAQDEIDWAQQQIGALAHPDLLFRPYAGGGVLDRRVFSQPTLSHLQRGGYTCVLWNSIPHDWDQPQQWVDNAMADVAAREWTVMVLHDIDTGAMHHLPRLLGELDAAGVEIVQEFPDECVPMLRGRLRAPLDHLKPLQPATSEDTP